MALNKVRQTIEMREARSGSVMDKHLTLRDLVNAGVVTLSIGNQNLVGNSEGSVVGGVGDVTIDIGGGTSPGSGYIDPRPSYVTPPTMTGLSVTGAFTSIILTWDVAPINFINFAYVEVWRNTTDNLGTAVLIGTSTSTLYNDESGSIGATYYYWVRSVNSEAAPGAFNAVSGVSGGRLLIGTTDLAPLVVEAANLADDAVVTAKIADAAVGLAKFAAGIEPVGIFGSVPGTLSTQAIVVGGKLYRWDGAAYAATIPTSDLTGQVSDAQIAGLAATKLTGHHEATDERWDRREDAERAAQWYATGQQ
jgi:hypothetical protein